METLRQVARANVMGRQLDEVVAELHQLAAKQLPDEPAIEGEEAAAARRDSKSGVTESQRGD